MVVLYPEAEIDFQLASEPAPPIPEGFVGPIATPQVEDGLAAITFKAADKDNNRGLSFNASITEAIGDTGDAGQTGTAVSTLALQLLNVDRSLIKRIPPNGLIRLRVGYKNVPGLGIRTVFFGFIDHIMPERDGSVVTWTITATNTPNLHLAFHVPFSAQDITIGHAIDYLVAQVGLASELPPVAYSTPIMVMEEYTSRATLGEELAYLVAELNRRVPGRHGRGSKPVYAPNPNHENPYVFRLVDTSGNVPFRSIRMSLDSPIIVSAAPSVGVAEADEELIADPESEGEPGIATDPASVVQRAVIREFRIVQAFDNRHAIGTVVQFEGSQEGNGSYIETSLRHRIGSTGAWVTETMGPWSGGDFLETLL
jgi:hypothetical protein